MTNLTAYIAINHYFMTVPEMSRETGEPDGRIRYIMEQNMWQALNPKDRVREYIKEHPNAILEDVAEKFEMAPAYIRNIAAGIGMRLITRLKAGIVQEEPAIKERSKYSLMHRVFRNADAEDIKKAFEKISGVEPGPIKRVREAYNQSGSPFGIADEVKNLKLNR